MNAGRWAVSKRRQHAFTPLAVVAVLVTGCGSAATTTLPASATGTPAASTSCASDDLDGTYRRTISSGDTSNADLYGDWTLTIDDCHFTISLDGAAQGDGRIDLVDRTAESGRVALSEDLCPNEFSGEGFYEVALKSDQLQIEEAIQASDQCQGRAEAFMTPPVWEREPN